MTDERFQQLIQGPLSHPLLPFRFTRLLLALRAVVESSPEAEKAFEAHCAARQKQDETADGVQEYGDIHDLVDRAEQRRKRPV